MSIYAQVYTLPCLLYRIALHMAGSRQATIGKSEQPLLQHELLQVFVYAELSLKGSKDASGIERIQDGYTVAKNLLV